MDIGVVARYYLHQLPKDWNYKCNSVALTSGLTLKTI